MPHHDANDIRILLVQLIEDDAFRESERDAFVRVGGFGAHQIEALDARGEPLGAHALDGFHAVVIADTPDRSSLDEFQEKEGLVAMALAVKEKKLPALGIGFGAHMLAFAYGGTVVRDGSNEEYGSIIGQRSRLAEKDPWFAELPARFMAEVAHRERVAKLPWGAMILASSERCPVLAFRMKEFPAYGLQFRPGLDAEAFATHLAHLADVDAAEAPSIRGAAASVQEAPQTAHLLRDWVRGVVLRRTHA